MKTILKVLALIIIIAIGIGITYFRWQVFQDATESDIGFWKWLFFIESK
jgi:hypothetical protein